MANSNGNLRRFRKVVIIALLALLAKYALSNEELRRKGFLETYFCSSTTRKSRIVRERKLPRRKMQLRPSGTKIDMYSAARRVQSIAGQAAGILNAIHTAVHPTSLFARNIQGV